MNECLIRNACTMLVRDTKQTIVEQQNPDAGGVYFHDNIHEVDQGDWMIYVVCTRGPGEAKEQVA